MDANTANKRKSATIFLSYIEAGLKLSRKQRKEYFEAVLLYLFDYDVPELKGAAAAVWEAVKPNLDNSLKQYYNGCKGAEHGKKGGAPKGNQNARKNNPQTTAYKNIEVEKGKGNNIEKKKENNNSLSLSIEQNHDYSFLSSLIFGNIDKNQSIIDTIEARTDADRITIQERINTFLREKSLGLQDPKWLCETQEQFVQLCINVVSYQLSKGYG